MNARERFHATCRFERPDRPLRWETIGFWAETYERWHKEGLPESVNDDVFSAPPFFGFDTMCWLPIAANPNWEPGFWPTFPDEIVEEHEGFLIKHDVGGNTVKVFTDGRSTIPQYLDHAVKTINDFETLRWRLDPETPERFTQSLDIMITLATSNPDCYTSASVCGLFGLYRNLMGLVGFSVAMKRDPALLSVIARQWVHMNAALIKKVRAKCPIDFIYFWEDMAYKNGPMLSPKAFAQFMAPYYRELIDSVRADTDIRVFCVDSDGDMWLLLPLFWDVGINMMLPFEVQAGMDIREVRKKFPRLIISGGIDKRALFTDEAAMREEVTSKVAPLLKSGGYIPALDHAVPPEVSLSNFQKFLKIVRKVS